MTKILKINNNCLNSDELDISLSTLKRGGVILYPTDTLYGLAVDIYNEKALKRVYSIKKRSLNKPLSICISDASKIPKVAKINEKTLKVISKLLPGPYTILLEKQDNISDLLTANSNKIGIRIPENKICQQLSKNFPITTTSANISNNKTESIPNLILKQLNSDIDLILDVGSLRNQEPSTIIDFTVDKPKIMREGIGLNNLKDKLNNILY